MYQHLHHSTGLLNAICRSLLGGGEIRHLIRNLIEILRWLAPRLLWFWLQFQIPDLIDIEQAQVILRDIFNTFEDKTLM